MMAATDSKEVAQGREVQWTDLLVSTRRHAAGYSHET